MTMTMKSLKRFALAAVIVTASYELHAQVSYDRILTAAAEPQNWLTYGGTYSSQRYSGLAQITPANVAQPRTEVDASGSGARRLAIDIRWWSMA